MSDRFTVDLPQLGRIARELGQSGDSLSQFVGQLRTLEGEMTAQAAPAQRARSQIASARRQVDAVQRDLLRLQDDVRRRAQDLATAAQGAGQTALADLPLAAADGTAAVTSVDALLQGHVDVLKEAGMFGKTGQKVATRGFDILTMRRHDMRDQFRSYGRVLNTLAGNKRAGWVGRMEQLSKMVPHVQTRRIPDWVSPTGQTLGRGVKGIGLLTTFTDELGVEQRSGRAGVAGTAEAAATTGLSALARSALNPETLTKVATRVGLEKVAPRIVSRFIPGVGWVLTALDVVHFGSAAAEWALDQTGHHDQARFFGTVKDVTDVDKHIRDAIRPAEDWFIGSVLDNPQAQKTLANGQLPLPAGP